MLADPILRQARSESNPLLSLQSLSKRYGKGPSVLEDFTATIVTGSFVSLVGASGCGKSTVLRLVAGLATASQGSVVWPGMGLTARKPRIGFVFQEPTLMPWADVLNNVLLPFSVKGRPSKDQEARALEALRSVGLAGREHAYPRELSGGMKMRVSIARALVTDPDLLLCDEPFAALDEITRVRLSNDLSRLHRQKGLTVLFVTHSISESVFLSDRVLVMAGAPGRISADIGHSGEGPRDEAYRLCAEYLARCTEVSSRLAEAMSL